jgi:WD40 repeat protein
MVYSGETFEKAAHLTLRDDLGAKRRYYDPEGDAIQQSLVPQERPLALAFVPGHSRLLLATAYTPASGQTTDFALKSWSFAGPPADPQAVWAWNEPSRQQRTRAWWFSADCQRAVAAGESGATRVIDLTSRGEIATLRGHKFAVVAAAFCPDGRSVATADKESVVLWSLASGEPTLQFKVAGCRRLQFAPGGRALAALTNNDPSSASGAYFGRCEIWQGASDDSGIQ